MSQPPPYASFGTSQGAPPSYMSSFSSASTQMGLSGTNQVHGANSSPHLMQSHNQVPHQSGPRHWYSQYYHTLNQQQLTHLQAWFNSVDTDNSGSISHQELSQMVMPGTGPFSGRVLGRAAATQLIKLFDLDGNGEIDFFEYAALHSFMDKLNSNFQLADSSKKGTIDYNETVLAMEHSGFGVSPYCVQRYFKKHEQGGVLDFVQFMHMTSEIAFVKAKFNALDVDRDGKLSADEVLHLCADVADNQRSILQSITEVNSVDKPVSKVDMGCIIS